MYIEAVIIGIVIGMIKKGKLTNITDVHFKGLFFVILSLVFQISPIFLVKVSLMGEYLHLFPFISLVLMSLAIVANFSKKGMKIILLGALLNIVVMALNNFYMPIDLKSLEWAGLTPLLESIKSGSVIGYMDISEASGMSKYLAKFIPIPSMYPFSKVLSLGDIILTLGIVQFFQGEMRRSYFRGDSSMIQFSYKTKFK